MIKKLQKKYALSEQGAKDLIKGCLACVLQNLSFMFPVGLLYYLVSDLMNGGVPGGKIPFYVAGCVVCIGLPVPLWRIAPSWSRVFRILSLSLRVRSFLQF